jgi:hypothetical protein
MKTLTLTKLVATWSDGKTEDLVKTLPEYLRDELNIYFAELEQLRAEHDAGFRDEPYTFEDLFNEHMKGETNKQD